MNIRVMFATKSVLVSDCEQQGEGSFETRKIDLVETIELDSDLPDAE